MKTYRCAKKLYLQNEKYTYQLDLYDNKVTVLRYYFLVYDNI